MEGGSHKPEAKVQRQKKLFCGNLNKKTKWESLGRDGNQGGAPEIEPDHACRCDPKTAV
jgi:hypothetical protein